MSAATLGLCFAHPDDEAYSVFGSVALHRQDPGLRVVVLHATDGEAGQTAPGVEAELGPGGLGVLRREEDVRGWDAVGHRPESHVWLGHPDGALAHVPRARLVDDVAAFLDRERPDVVVTFGPDGVTGHPDHVAIGAATDAAFDLVRRDGGPGLRRLLHWAVPQSWFDRHQTFRVTRGIPPWQPDRMFHLRAVPDDLIGVHVHVDAVVDRVLAGLREHRSQRAVLMPSESEVDEETFRRGLRHEWFSVVRPVPVSGAPLLTDLFEGLDAGVDPREDPRALVHRVAGRR